MSKILRLPKRSKVKTADTWDLSSLCASDEEWEKEFAKLDKLIPGFEKFKGKLGEGAKTLAACLKYDGDFERLGEKVGGYAHLKVTEDQAESKYQGMVGRFQNLATRASQACVSQTHRRRRRCAGTSRPASRSAHPVYLETPPGRRPERCTNARASASCAPAYAATLRR